MSQTSTSGAELTSRSLPVLPRRAFGQTNRKGLWWITPLLTFMGLGGFVVYATWRAFEGDHYWLGSYLSPFYSPEIWGSSPHAWIKGVPPLWPSFLRFSPALIILGAPGGFRFTCYYYRGAYYKAFWADPISCAVGEPRKSYLGENHLPLILQNVHRYFLYLAILFLFLLGYDAIRSLFWDEGGHTKIHLGLGTIVLTVNLCLLVSYTFGCHSLRHLIAGGRDEVSKSGAKKAYDCVSCLNGRHMLFAWCSLFSVAFSDFYIRCISTGLFHDWRLF